MDIHILTPFYRKKLAKTLVYYWKPQNIKWYPLMAPSDYVEFPNESWIRPIMVSELYPMPGHPHGPFSLKVDEFREKHPIVDEDYYGVTCDETLYEPGFFDALRKQTAKVVVCSSYRGDKTPPGGHYKGPPTICVAKKVEQLKRNYIGLGQYFVKGEILKAVPYIEYAKDNKTLLRSDDGHYIVEMRKRYPNDIAILTDWFSFANYLQPGRWNNTQHCIKPNWEVPKYIGIDIEKEKDTLHE